jgi:hypothetical protein
MMDFSAIGLFQMLTRTSRACAAGAVALVALGLAACESVPLVGRGPIEADRLSLCLWSDRPATAWMTEAYPIGNGPMGAMLFGGTEIERVQFNEVSLWSGARVAVEGLGEEGQDLGSY